MFSEIAVRTSLRPPVTSQRTILWLLTSSQTPRQSARWRALCSNYFCSYKPYCFRVSASKPQDVPGSLTLIPSVICWRSVENLLSKCFKWSKSQTMKKHNVKFFDHIYPILWKLATRVENDLESIAAAGKHDSLHSLLLFITLKMR